jgi:hypothetical protein
MIRSSAGAELCATRGVKRPHPSECAHAVDQTYKGDVDLSDRVVVGEPIQKSPLHWVVPYDVTDDAGNQATTVWRDIIVDEVDLVDAETKIRQEVLREQQTETKKAVEKAVREEKQKWERELAAGQQQTTGSRSRNNKQNCPSCPNCDCPTDVKLGKAACRPFCEGEAGTCSVHEENLVYTFIMKLEEVFPPSVVSFMVFSAVFITLFLVFRFLATLIFNPRSMQGYDYTMYSDRVGDGALFHNPAQQTMQPDPRVFPSSQQTNSQDGAFFSPRSQAGISSPPPFHPPPGSASRQDNQFDNSIYRPMPDIISPSRTGDGARRRTPYG